MSSHSTPINVTGAVAVILLLYPVISIFLDPTTVRTPYLRQLKSIIVPSKDSHCETDFNRFLLIHYP